MEYDAAQWVFNTCAWPFAARATAATFCIVPAVGKNPGVHVLGQR